MYCRIVQPATAPVGIPYVATKTNGTGFTVKSTSGSDADSTGVQATATTPDSATAIPIRASSPPAPPNNGQRRVARAGSDNPTAMGSVAFTRVT